MNFFERAAMLIFTALFDALERIERNLVYILVIVVVLMLIGAAFSAGISYRPCEPIRTIDNDAGVVCYQTCLSRQGAISCLPISQTNLESK